MHVAINAHLLSDHAGYRSAGVSNYSRHLLTALGQVAVASSDLRLTAFAHARSFAASGVTVRWGSPRLCQRQRELGRPPDGCAPPPPFFPRRYKFGMDAIIGLVPYAGKCRCRCR